MTTFAIFIADYLFIFFLLYIFKIRQSVFYHQNLDFISDIPLLTTDAVTSLASIESFLYSHGEATEAEHPKTSSYSKQTSNVPHTTISQYLHPMSNQPATHSGVKGRINNYPLKAPQCTVADAGGLCGSASEGSFQNISQFQKLTIDTQHSSLYQNCSEQRVAPESTEYEYRDQNSTQPPATFYRSCDQVVFEPRVTPDTTYNNLVSINNSSVSTVSAMALAGQNPAAPSTVGNSYTILTSPWLTCSTGNEVSGHTAFGSMTTEHSQPSTSVVHSMLSTIGGSSGEAPTTDGVVANIQLTSEQLEILYMSDYQFLL